jgi:hypothetical protein
MSGKYFINELYLIYPLALFGLIVFFQKILTLMDIKKKILLYLPTVIAACLLAAQLPGYYATPKTPYREMAQYIINTSRKGDVLLSETFNPFGQWEPFLYGRGLYFNDEILQLPIRPWTSFVKSNANLKGRTRLLLHLSVEEANKISISESYTAKKIKNLLLISPKNNHLSYIDDAKRLLDEMIRIYPETSARADLYASKAYLICDTNYRQARVLIQKALTLERHPSFDGICRER